MLCGPGNKQGPLSQVLQSVISSVAYLRRQGQGGQCILPSLVPSHDRRVVGPILLRLQLWGWLAHVAAYRVSSTLLGLLSQVLQLLRSKDSSPALITSGTALPPSTGGEGWREGVSSPPVPAYGQ